MEENNTKNQETSCNNMTLPMLDEDTTAVRRLQSLLEITFTKDEVEDFYSKFPGDPLTAIFAA